jgi:L-iditol 2-dehydrogenase
MSATVRALVYRFRPGLWLAARWADRRASARWAVAVSGLRLERLSLDRPPQPGWVRLRVLLAGICGTDVATLRGRLGPELSPFVSFPAVLGHEVLAEVSEGPLAGERVVLDPFLGCTVRGLAPCPACSAGQGALCHRFAEGALAPGMLLGYCRDVPGGWAEELWAHPSQLHRVPPGLDERRAVLAEPLAVAMHAVLRQPPQPGDRVLVLGAGTIGLCVLAALRALVGPTEVAVVARYDAQARVARRLGAVHVLRSPGAVEDLVAARRWGRSFPGLLGTRAWTGGFDQVYDAVGSTASLALGLRLLRAGGRLVLLGGGGRLSWDPTPVWVHEVAVHGSCGYGAEPAAGGEHTVDLALRLLSEHPSLPLEELVTHRFGLAAWRRALETVFDHRHSGAIKVVFAPQEG